MFFYSVYFELYPDNGSHRWDLIVKRLGNYARICFEISTPRSDLIKTYEKIRKRNNWNRMKWFVQITNSQHSALKQILLHFYLFHNPSIAIVRNINDLIWIFHRMHDQITRPAVRKSLNTYQWTIWIEKLKRKNLFAKVVR